MVKKKYTKKIAVKYAGDYVRHLRAIRGLSVEQAFLFGSYVSGQQRDSSDIDVCVVLSGRNQKDILERLWLARRAIDVKRGIEPVGFIKNDFVDISNPLVNEVRRTGIKVI